MEVGPFLEALELLGSLEVPFHHIKEPIVVLGGAPRILHEERARVPQATAHRRAERHHLLLRPPIGATSASAAAATSRSVEVGGEIHDGEVHRRRWRGPVLRRRDRVVRN